MLQKVKTHSLVDWKIAWFYIMLIKELQWNKSFYSKDTRTVNTWHFSAHFFLTIKK